MVDVSLPDSIIPSATAAYTRGPDLRFYWVSLFYGTERNVLLHYFPERNNCLTLVYMKTLLVWDCGVIHAATQLHIYSLHLIFYADFNGKCINR